MEELYPIIISKKKVLYIWYWD